MATASRQLWRRGLQLLAHASDDSCLRVFLSCYNLTLCFARTLLKLFWIPSTKSLARPGAPRKPPELTAQDSDQRWQVYGEAEAVFGEPWRERKKERMSFVLKTVKTHRLQVTWGLVGHRSKKNNLQQLQKRPRFSVSCPY